MTFGVLYYWDSAFGMLIGVPGDMKILRRTLIAFIFLYGINLSLSGQEVEEFRTYKFAGVQYKVPASWDNDGFGSYKPAEWNEHGSAVCECTGFIHLDYESDLKMVFYPSSMEDLESERHNMVWDYRYVSSEEIEMITVGKINFEREISTFENNEEYVVWRYKCQVKKYGYIIYFFASPEVIEKNSETIDAIIGSFKKSNTFKLKIE